MLIIEFAEPKQNPNIFVFTFEQTNFIYKKALTLLLILILLITFSDTQPQI